MITFPKLAQHGFAQRSKAENKDPLRLPYVFISYRRDDSAASAGRIFDWLIDCFGKENVFRDLDRIAPGAEFAAVITAHIARCDAFIVIIGREWLNASDAGKRRLDDPKDFVRTEICEAFRLNKRVFPVLVEGAAMPKMSKLPRDIAALTGRNAIEISESRFDYDVKRLIKAIDSAATTTTHQQVALRFLKLSSHVSPSRILLMTATASIVILVFSEVILGWTFDSAEISLIVLVVLGLIMMLSRIITKRKQHGKSA